MSTLVRFDDDDDTAAMGVRPVAAFDNPTVAGEDTEACWHGPPGCGICYNESGGLD